MKHRQIASACAAALIVSLAGAATAAPTGVVPASGPSDFTFDQSFGSEGTTTLEFENGTYQWDEPLAVFADEADGGYWVTGYNRSVQGGADHFAVGKLLADGNPDATVGTAGDLLLPIAGAEIRVVTMADDRFYVAEAVLGNGADIVVDCFELGGSPCVGFGDGGHVQIAFDLGTMNNDDLAAAIAVDGGSVYVAGNMATPPAGDDFSNPGIGIVKLDAETGALDEAFGNLDALPGRALYQLDRVVDGGDYVATNGLSITTTTDGQTRLLITGNTPTSNVGDAEGFVLAVDAASGHLVADFGDNGVRYLALPRGETFSEVMPTAMRVRHNGRILIAGDYWHDIGGMVDPEIVIAELTADGDLAADFGDNGLVHYLPGYHVETVGVAERPGSGDVVATFMTAGLYPDEYTDYQQALIQVDRHGRQVRALTAITYPSNGVDTSPRSRPAPQGVQIDSANRTVMFGWRNWQFQPQQGFLNRDMTVARFVAEDSVFANGFGGAYAD